MKKILFIIMTILIFIISGCSNNGLDTVKKDTADQIENLVDKNNEYVLMVKNGYPNDFPNSTYGDSFEKFFSSPTWKYFKSDDGKDVVEFTGNCTYQDVKVKARMQFILDVDAGTFEAGALSFNDVPQNKLITAALLSKAFEDETTKTTSSTESQTESQVNSNDTAQEIFYGDWIISRLLNYNGIGSYSNDDINKKIIGNQLSFSKEQSSSFGDDLSYMKNIINNPTYEKLALSKDDFEAKNDISFDSIGVKEESITEINVIDSNNDIQCDFYIVDQSTLILYGGGAYFELHKK
jgi:uncharacterized protein YxeA